MKQELRKEPFPGCFLLFAGAKYYPDGGVEDLIGCGEKEELERWFVENQDWREWAHVVNYATMRVVSVFEAKQVFNKADGTALCFDRRFVDQ